MSEPATDRHPQTSATGRGAFLAAVQAPASHAVTQGGSVEPSARSREDSESFDVPVHPEGTRVRVHVQWRGRIADVWLGVPGTLLDRLPSLCAHIDQWLQARDGVLGQLTCNGDVLLTRVAPDPQGDF